MLKYNIDLICLQESHRPKSDYYVTDAGYLVILSRAAGSCKEYAGVGFVVAPWIRRSVVGFCQYSNRLASLKLRVPGGKAVFFSAYAPRSGKSFDERQTFFFNPQRKSFRRLHRMDQNMSLVIGMSGFIEDCLEKNMWSDLTFSQI